ncbi:hypothetical protein HBB16_07030 [Pseudonocardia sp. MCCB 268]|nr:hypothetical protein [Pseudonocardia cytotoxica]
MPGGRRAVLRVRNDHPRPRRLLAEDRSAVPIAGRDQWIPYHHFGSWAGFVRGLPQHWEDDRLKPRRRAGSRDPDPLERLRAVRRLAVELHHGAEVAIRARAQPRPEVGRAQDVQRRSRSSR